MERVLIIGASGGIGAALVDSVSAPTVVGLSRSTDGLDITDDASIERVLGALKGRFDLIVVATGILGQPEKSLSAINADLMAQVMAANAIGPAMILRQVPRLLAQAGRVVVLSARVGSISDNRLGGWHSYRASKAALNQIIRGAALELARTHKGSICVAMHPGTVDTAFTQSYRAENKSSADIAAKQLLSVIKELTPDQTGGFFDNQGIPIEW